MISNDNLGYEYLNWTSRQSFWNWCIALQHRLCWISIIGPSQFFVLKKMAEARLIYWWVGNRRRQPFLSPSRPVSLRSHSPLPRCALRPDPRLGGLSCGHVVWNWASWAAQHCVLDVLWDRVKSVCVDLDCLNHVSLIERRSTRTRPLLPRHPFSILTP